MVCDRFRDLESVEIITTVQQCLEYIDSHVRDPELTRDSKSRYIGLRWRHGI
jgi:hypothetical protein